MGTTSSFSLTRRLENLRYSRLESLRYVKKGSKNKTAVAAALTATIQKKQVHRQKLRSGDECYETTNPCLKWTPPLDNAH
jgi:hypothetical protein